MQHNFNKGFEINEVSYLCRKAYISAVIKMLGSIGIKRKNISLEIQTQEGDYAFFLVDLLKKLGVKEVCINNTVIDKTHKLNGFIVEIEHPLALNFLNEMEIIKLDEHNTVSEIEFGMPNKFQNINEIQFYIKGIVDSKGKLFIPDASSNEYSSGYRFEITNLEEAYANDIITKLEDFNLKLKFATRKDVGMIYCTDGNAICDLFTFINNVDVVFLINNTFASRSLLKRAVSISNCETANIDRAIAASEKLLKAVNILKNHNIFEKLKDELKIIAKLKYDNLSITLDEIAEKLNVTKSCINHRIRKIIKMAEALNEKTE